MITIALDENGDFEGLKGSGGEPIFLAGLLYDDGGDEYDTQNERKRIIEYYKRICAEEGCRFPESLHMNHAGNNSDEVAKVKQKVNANLQEFLRDGTYQKKVLIKAPRRGKYLLFMQLKSNQGKKELQGKDLCQLVKDDFASNLYMHMAENVVSRLIFHNPYRQDIRKVRFDLPTRMVVIPHKQTEKIAEYIKLGYKDFKFDKTKPADIDKNKYMQIANENNYRAAIGREILTSGKTNIDVERMSVNSIHYGPIGMKGAKSTAFLYLADSICSLLNWNKTGNNPVEWLECFASRAHELNGSAQNIFFAYDDVDILFEQAWRAFEEGNYFKALDLSFTAKKSASPFADFYQKNWFPVLEKQIGQQAAGLELALSLRRFQEYSYEENIEQERLCYIFEKLQQIADEKIKTGELDKAAAFDLYDAGFSAYNHMGQSKLAEQCFYKCNKLAPFVDIETYMRTLNKYSVWRNDMLDFAAAKEAAEVIVLYINDLAKMRDELFGNKSDKFAVCGRANSQCGQAYAFVKDKQAEKYFMEALRNFDEASPDYFITLSYLLHHYIEQGDAEKYDHYAAIYFGGQKEPQKQFEFIMQHGQGKKALFTLKFAFFVFIKGLCKFHRKEVKGQLRSDLLDIEKTFHRYHADEQINGHPWEIIYKHLGILAFQQGKKAIAEAYMAKTENIIKQRGAIIEAIIENGKREFALLTQDEAKALIAQKNMTEAVARAGNSLSAEDVSKRLCYMYD